MGQATHGGIYEGQFENAKRHGTGKFVFAEPYGKRLAKGDWSISYEGEWKNDLPDGEGVIGSGDGFSKVIVQDGKVIKAKCLFGAKGKLTKALQSITPTPVLKSTEQLKKLTCQLPSSNQPWDAGQ